ncbi:MAG TPA: aminotransferase class V-fold PLP-dependent enzyme [Streptosporangiaceae bacterium]|jgi:pyridoxal 5-phosphate dependent beta-lyase
MADGHSGLGDAGVTLDAPWQQWRDRRPPAQRLHMDSAAAGRSSDATRRAVAAHAEREAEIGAYVAEGEADPILEAGRAELAGLLGVPPGGVAFVESGSAALASVLSAWPLEPGSAVAVAPSEWGPNLASFGHNDLKVVELAVHGDGTVDLEALEGLLAGAPPAFVHLTQVASHRGLIQPVAAVAALCRAAGVPLWVDVAQALGHVDTATGADVLYATSRKWLTGPRGVGLLAISDRWWDTLQIHASPLDLGELPEGAARVQLLESREANVAGRVGLCTAVREYLDAGPAQVQRRLAEVGALAREVLGGLPGWAVHDTGAPAAAITALRPTAGQDVREVRARLLSDHLILTTAEGLARAPREMTEPLLRISPHVDCAPEELQVLRDALAALS